MAPLCTRAELAAFFGVAPAAVQGWVRRGCPVSARAKGRGVAARFSAPDVVRWREQQLERAAGVDSPGDTDSAKALRLRLLRARAEDVEHELAKRRDQLMTAEDFDRSVGAAFARVEARLRASVPRLAAAAVGVEALHEGLARMEPEVDAILRELAAGEDIPRESTDRASS